MSAPCVHGGGRSEQGSSQSMRKCTTRQCTQGLWAGVGSSGGSKMEGGRQAARWVLTSTNCTLFAAGPLECSLSHHPLCAHLQLTEVAVAQLREGGATEARGAVTRSAPRRQTALLLSFPRELDPSPLFAAASTPMSATASSAVLLIFRRGGLQLGTVAQAAP